MVYASSMRDYDELNDRLHARYRSLSEERGGAPVYAIEHGFDERGVHELKNAVAGRVHAWSGIGSTIAWPFVAFAAEIGYSYEGLFAGYWPRLEAALGLPLRGREREALSEHHERAFEAVGLARPDDTPFARAFRHIAWPLANALVPRQIHAGLCTALFEAVVLDAADSALLRAVQQGCRRDGSQALVYWAAEEARVDAVATALLDAPDARLSLGIVQRLQRDMMATSNVRDMLVRARMERKRRNAARTRPGTGASEAAVPVAKGGEPLEPPFELRGGLRIGHRSYALGVPATLLAYADLRVTQSGGLAEGTRPLAAGEALALAPDGTAQVAVAYRDLSGEKRSVSLRIDPVDPPPALVAMRAEPTAPTLADLRERRLAMLAMLSSPPDDRRAARWPGSLRDVEVRLELRLAGHRTLYARDRFSTVPGRLNGVEGGLAVLSDGLRRYEETMGIARVAVLVVDWGAGRRLLELIDPEPTIRWHEDEGGWHASSVDHSEDLPVRYVSASDPLAVPGSEPTREGSQLHVVEGVTAPNLLVDGPRRLRMTDVSSSSVVHRRLVGSDGSRGLSGEIEAWLGWRCAHPTHVVAEIEARSASKVAERAVLTTLCGSTWVEAEERLPLPRPFALRFAEAAISLDLIKVEELRSFGEHIEPDDVSELAFALARALMDRLDVRRRPTTELGDREAALLDASVDQAWRDLTPSRARRTLPPVDSDTGNDPEAWDEAWSQALAARERPDLAALILPPRLASALVELDYEVVETLEVARLIGALRIDRGTLARQARRLSGSDILSALSLWNSPRTFSAIDWRPLALSLLEDRMTARAVRYASLRMADEGTGT